MERDAPTPQGGSIPHLPKNRAVLLPLPVLSISLRRGAEDCKSFSHLLLDACYISFVSICIYICSSSVIEVRHPHQNCFFFSRKGCALRSDLFFNCVSLRNLKETSAAGGACGCRQSRTSPSFSSNTEHKLGLRGRAGNFTDSGTELEESPNFWLSS